MTTFQEGMPHMKGDWVNNLSQLIGFFPHQMSNLGPVTVWAAGRQWLDEQTFLWRLFSRSVQLLLLSIIVSCNMQSLHCLKSQLPSKVQYKTGNFAVIAYFDTREMFARMNAARKQMALWLTGKSCEWRDRCVQKRQKDSSALSANESPIEWYSFFFFLLLNPSLIQFMEQEDGCVLGVHVASVVKQCWSLWVV